MKLLEKLKQTQSTYYSYEDIAERLMTLACMDDLEDDSQIRKELEDALFDLKTTAENKLNHDYFRVLYNILLMIAGMDIESK